MIKRLYILALLVIGFAGKYQAQHQYYKSPIKSVVMEFNDSANRLKMIRIDSAGLLSHQFSYILKFYPSLLAKKIYVSYSKSSKLVVTKPKFGSIFKSPEEREYNITFSKKTNSTLDSVMLQNLTFNAQLGMIANQISQIENFSTDGFFDTFAWFFRRLSRKGRNENYLENEEKTLEVGLGYQLLALNRELEQNLKIENWLNTNGYTGYARQMKNQAMKPELILNFISDLPIYIAKSYK